MTREQHIAREIRTLEDMSKDELRRYVDAKSVLPDDEAELANLFLDHAAFLDVVLEGGAWPMEAFCIMHKRTHSLLERNAGLGTKLRFAA